MKWKVGLLTLGLLVGLSPLAPILHQGSLPSEHLAQAATRDETSYSGTIGSGETSIPWTLDNGTLTLQGGTLRKFSGRWMMIPNGQLLTDLVEDNQAGLTKADFQAKVQKINIAGKLNVGANPAYLFANFSSVTTYTGLNNLDVSNLDATGLAGPTGLMGMFAGNQSLTTFTAPSFTANNPHSIANMFQNDSSLVYLDLSKMQTDNTTNLNGLTLGCTALQVLNLGNFSSSDKLTSNYKDYIDANAQINCLTVSPTHILNDSGLYDLTNSNSMVTNRWQEVGNGKVSFNLNRQPPFAGYDGFLQNYQVYDPQGAVLGDSDTTVNDSTQQLLNLYDGQDHGLTGNQTYVREPQPGMAIKEPEVPAPTPTPSPTTPTENDTADFQQFYLSAIKKIGLYSRKNFSAANRLAWFAKKPQMKQPTFLVTGVTTSKAGNDRYQVRDTNRHSQTYGETGYVTTKNDYVTASYYQNAPQTVTVINPGGINGYGSAALSQPQVAYAQGKQLAVKKVVTRGKTTRLLLTNGKYISGNRHFVVAGKYSVPVQIRAKTAVNRYANVNLTQRKQHYPQQVHHTFKVLGWDYSQGQNTTTAGTLRYRVAGGYITANPRLVRAMR
ncbi:DUF5776 domain-containing protein [Levilactobacillus tongjiangensis]|uniref:DUF5776 domain-containing protein n=1 Tax=Levilactobacillus tongjiangensis TaxID=2486023 RepID=A0ABW1SPP4_9LACO|nr:DUF5776 domain-containing protein [Levilactobacillus tongjiangensis]